MIGMFLLVVTNVSALTLKLEPSKLNLTGNPNEKICTNLNIEYSVYDGLVEGRDLWAEKGVIEKDLSLHTLDAEDLDLIVSYPKSVRIIEDKDINVCVTASDVGLYHGALLYQTKQTGMVGIELNVWITVNIEEDLENNNDKGSSKKKRGGGGGGGDFSSDSNDFSFLSSENTGAKTTGGIIDLTDISNNDKNNKDSFEGGFLIIMILSLSILIVLVGILSVKKSKKRS